MKGNKKVEVTLVNAFGLALALIFITLKLTGHISWSWWWVLSPFWIPVAVAAVVFVAVLVVLLLADLIRRKA